MIARPSIALLIVLATACGDGTTFQITSATPPYGPLVGGTSIVLTGSGFTTDGAAPDRVLIGGREAPLATAIDDTRLAVVIPAGERPGDAEVLVFNHHGNTRVSGIFHYSAPPTITDVSPADVLFSDTGTVVTLTGTGFLDEGAGEVAVVVDDHAIDDVRVTSDTSLRFTVPPGRPLTRPAIGLVDGRGRATAPRGFRYVPSLRAGLLLFSTFGSEFAVFFDPVDNSIVTIPWIGAPTVRLTAVVRDAQGEYWAADRSQRFGRLDLTAQTLTLPIQTQGWFPAMVRADGVDFALDRASMRFGTLDPLTGSFLSIGNEALPCCGSFGLAFDGTTLYFTAMTAGVPSIATIDRSTGVAGPPVTIAGSPQLHIEDLRFFDGTLYATSRDGTLVTIDPTTGATTVLPVSLGRFSAMEVFE